MDNSGRLNGSKVIEACRIEPFVILDYLWYVGFQLSEIVRRYLR